MLVPRELEAETRGHRRREGIPTPAAGVRLLNDAARDYGRPELVACGLTAEAVSPGWHYASVV